MQGLHLIGDFEDCNCAPAYLRSAARFRSKCADLVRDAGLTTVGDDFHQFSGANAGFTGTVVLAESHLAIHTWPERRAFTLDVYVCNYSKDNSEKARTLFESVVAYFEPASAAKQEIYRGDVSMSGRPALAFELNYGNRNARADSGLSAHRAVGESSLHPTSRAETR
ncbi:MAG: adenosylmethionine decarboxylase [Nitrospiraceae bacterium]|nr:adenosylmethionine decarboxylase [Nitrospiraceae bacterium]